MLRQRIEPTPRGVIVVRSRISNGVWAVMVGEMRITRISIEAELEHSNSPQLELIAKRNHIGSDNAEVLGNERQMAQLRPDGSEESSARTGNPMPGFSAFRGGRNVPGGAKRPEVIKPNQVHVGQQRFQPVN